MDSTDFVRPVLRRSADVGRLASYQKISTEALRARKQAGYASREDALFAALREKWPAQERAPELRVIAMMGIGAMRLAAEQWSAEKGELPLRAYLDETFRHLLGQAGHR